MEKSKGSGLSHGLPRPHGGEGGVRGARRVKAIFNYPKGLKDIFVLAAIAVFIDGIYIMIWSHQIKIGKKRQNNWSNGFIIISTSKIKKTYTGHQ